MQTVNALGQGVKVDEIDHKIEFGQLFAAPEPFDFADIVERQVEVL